MINTAAKLILSDNRSIFLERYIYPTENEISDIKTCESLLPGSLRKFRQVLIKGRLKRSSVRQVIVSAARPKSAVLLITFGLGVEMDDMFGSRRLIDELSKVSYSVSYDKNKLYKRSVMYIKDDLLSAIARRKPDFVRWVPDNAYHNVSTLDGKNTFQGMGIIAVSIRKSCNFRTRIPREKRK